MLLTRFRSRNGIHMGVFDSSKNEISKIICSATEVQDFQFFMDLWRKGELRALERDKPIAAESVEILTPMSNPIRNIFCVGKNYADHVNEVHSMGLDTGDRPQAPIIFTKATTTVIGPNDAIHASQDPTQSVDYEGELAVIIGRQGKNILPSDAHQYVFGYTICNDVTSRVLQKKHGQWFIGKSLDSFCPLGPHILVAEDLMPRHFDIQTWVNEELRQKSSTRQMIFSVDELISTLSTYITLLPGDIIATGTPAGVGAGYTPPKYLRPGDQVTVEISEIGVLRNSVI